MASRSYREMLGSFRNGHSAASTVHDHPDPIAQSVADVVSLDQRDRLTMTWSDRLANRITAFSGSMLFFYLNAAWFAIWIPLNLGWLGVEPFDPFPFGLLTMIVSLEAIFLATFVLISQNRQAQLADRRAKVDLQVDMVAEQEVTKIMQLLIDIHDHLGINHQDPNLRRLAKPTDITKLLDAMDAAEQEVDPKGARGPESAVDTEA